MPQPPNPFSIHLEKEDFTVIFRCYSQSKSIRITLKPDATILVTAATMLTKQEIIHTVITHKDWIIRKWAVIRMQQPQPVHRFESGESLFYRGKSLTLRLFPCEKATFEILPVHDTLQIKIPKDIWTAPPTKRHTSIHRALVAWYSHQAKVIIRERLDYYHTYYPFPFHRIAIKNQKTRWGSCSTKGNLNFNWRLVMMPPEILDYIVVHELCHLKEMNHSPRFWAWVARQVPDYLEKKNWLKKNGHLYHLSSSQHV